MTVAWYQAQWSASSSSSFLQFLPRGNRTIVPRLCKASAVASSNTCFSTLFLLSSSWNKQALQVSYLLT